MRNPLGLSAHQQFELAKQQARRAAHALAKAARRLEVEKARSREKKGA